jgi:hypothetical protein
MSWPIRTDDIFHSMEIIYHVQTNSVDEQLIYIRKMIIEKLEIFARE